MMDADSAARRALPHGYRDGEHEYFVPRPFRTYYRCVTAPPHSHRSMLGEHLAVLDAAAEWAYADHVRRHGPGVIPE